MSVSLTAQNKRTIKTLLATGRWANESEIFRYGLHLVEKEVRRSDLAPMPKEKLARALAQRTAEERAEDQVWDEASVRASRIALEDEE